VINDGAGIIEQLRIVKSPAEIEKIATAASMSMPACAPGWLR
jgi:Xaa-Pro aminopeptidase